MTINNPYLDRWQTPEGRDLLWETASWIATGGALPRGFGLTEEGRLDLRGASIPDPVESGTIVIPSATPGETMSFGLTSGKLKIVNREWANVDLSFSYLPELWVTDSSFTNCLFDDAVLRAGRIWDTNVTDCSFRRSDLRDTAIGTSTEPTRATTWKNISFAKAVMTGRVLFSGWRVDNVSFEGAHISNMAFTQCTISRATFTGTMSKVQFDFRPLKNEPTPGPLTDSDFTCANFDDVKVQGVHLKNTRFPDNARIVNNYPLVVLGAIEFILENDPVGSKFLVDHMFLPVVKSNSRDLDSADVFMISDFVEDGDDSFYRELDQALRAGEAALKKRGFTARAADWEAAVRAVA